MTLLSAVERFLICFAFGMLAVSVLIFYFVRRMSMDAKVTLGEARAHYDRAARLLAAVEKYGVGPADRELVAGAIVVERMIAAGRKS